MREADVNAPDDGYVIINGRRYPSLYLPGSHWAIDEAWRILDMLKDGAIPENVRLLLAGMIAGALMKARKEPGESSRMR
jgi:hypothetical protein